MSKEFNNEKMKIIQVEGGSRRMRIRKAKIMDKIIAHSQ